MADRRRAAAEIRSVPLERWFVMTGEEPLEGADALALVDDEFRFRTYAYGRLEPA